MERKFNYQEECQMIDTTVLLFMTNPHPPPLKKCTGRLMGHMAHLGMEQQKSRPGDHCSKKRSIHWLAISYHFDPKIFRKFFRRTSFLSCL